MKMTKNEALLKLAMKVMDTRLKPVLDKCMSMDRDIRPIPYNADIDNNDYMEYLAKKENKLVHIQQIERGI